MNAELLRNLPHRSILYKHVDGVYTLKLCLQGNVWEDVLRRVTLEGLLDYLKQRDSDDA